ncbi:MAG: DUF951 domain-containing protein [Bacillota bacterium]
MIDPAKIEIGQVIKLKKAHPCGGFLWQVVDLGMDCRLKCQTCGHVVLLSRHDLTRRVVAVLPKDLPKK